VPRIDRLLDKHSRDLDRLTDKEAKAFLRAYRDSAKELTSSLAAVGATAGQEQRMRIMLAQLRSGIRQLEKRLGVQLDVSTQEAQIQSLYSLLGTIRKAEPELGEVAGLVETGATRRLVRHRGLALHRHSVERYGRALIDDLQREIVASTLANETVDQLERRLKRRLRAQEHRAWLIARMELSRAYNDAHLEGIKEADAQLPGGMGKQIHETADRRNHPFSRAAHGVTAKADEVFKVPVAAVIQAGAALNKPIGGILWKRRGANFVGSNLPAHFGERGRVVPWREAWEKPDDLADDLDELLAAPQEETGFPFAMNELESLGRNGLGGMHSKVELAAPGGSRWLFKPYSHRKIGGVDQSFRAYADKAAADFAKAVGQPYSDTFVVTLPKGHPGLRAMGMDGPVTGSIQRMNTNVSGIFGETAPTALSRKQLNQAQREHVLDWMISNHDAHGENLLFTTDVGVLGIDKGQAFRFFGRDSIGMDYNPNPVDSWYNKTFRRYAAGEYGRDYAIHGPKRNRQLGAFIKRIEDMPEEEFLAIFEPYVTAADRAGVKWNGMDAATFRQSLLERRRNLRTTVVDFYADIEARRLAALPPEVSTVTKLDKAWIKDAADAGLHGRAAHLRHQDFRSGELLIHGLDGNGAIGEAYLTDRGNDAVQRVLGRSVPERILAAPVDPYADDMAKLMKSLVAHVGDPNHSAYDGKIPSHTKNLWDSLVMKLWQGSEHGDAVAAHHWGYLQTHVLGPYKVGHFAMKDADEVAAMLKPQLEKVWTTLAWTKPYQPAKVPDVVKAKAARQPFTIREIQTREWDARIQAGRIKFEGEAGRSYGDGGTTWEIDFHDRPLRVLYAHKEDHNLRSKSGRLRLVWEKPIEQLTPEDIQGGIAALKELGLDSELAELGDLEALYLLKVTRIAKLDKEDAFRVAPGTDSAKVVSQLRKAWSDHLGKDVTKLKGYKPLPNYRADMDGKAWGRPWWERFDITDADLQKANLNVFHDTDFGGGNTERFIENATKGRALGLVSTEDKLRVGIPLSDGGSPTADMRSGGSRYTYTRLRAGRATKRSNRIHFDRRVLLDADAITYASDNFGADDEVTFRDYHAGQNVTRMVQAARQSGNETIVKHFLGLHRAKWIDVATEASRGRILEHLRQAGITKLGTKAVEDVVRVVGY